MNTKVSALVAKYRDDKSPVLEVDIPLHRRLDSSDCSSLQADLKRLTHGWEAYLATDTLDQHLPNSPGLYMFVWRPPLRFQVSSGPHIPFDLSQILYIGRAGGDSSNTLRNRYRSYAKYLSGDPEQLWSYQEPVSRDARLARYLTLHPIEYWCNIAKFPSELDNLESRLIRLINPPVNRDRRPQLRARAPVAAFQR